MSERVREGKSDRERVSSQSKPPLQQSGVEGPLRGLTETEFFIDNLLVRIHLIMEMMLVDRPCAMRF